MPPLQPLYLFRVRIINADGPFPSTDFDINVISRKMKIWEENLGGRVVSCWRVRFQCKGKRAVPEVEPIRRNASYSC